MSMCNSINQKSKFEGSVTASKWWKDTGFTLILRDGLFVLVERYGFYTYFKGWVICIGGKIRFYTYFKGWVICIA